MKRMPGPLALAAAGMLLFGALLAALWIRRGEHARFTPVPGHPGQYKTLAALRSLRRAYDGAPPVIPHASFNMACVGCHTDQGMFVPEVGFAPAMPHLGTPGLSRASNCRQCHVFRETEALLVGSAFEGRPQDLRRGSRMYPHAPPVLPHPVFMREDCAACHSGPAAREELRCTHPERLRCAQCHVPSFTSETYPSGP